MDERVHCSPPLVVDGQERSSWLNLTSRTSRRRHTGRLLVVPADQQ